MAIRRPNSDILANWDSTESSQYEAINRGTQPTVPDYAPGDGTEKYISPSYGGIGIEDTFGFETGTGPCRRLTIWLFVFGNDPSTINVAYSIDGGSTFIAQDLPGDEETTDADDDTPVLFLLNPVWTNDLGPVYAQNPLNLTTSGHWSSSSVGGITANIDKSGGSYILSVQSPVAGPYQVDYSNSTVGGDYSHTYDNLESGWTFQDPQHITFRDPTVYETGKWVSVSFSVSATESEINNLQVKLTSSYTSTNLVRVYAMYADVESSIDESLSDAITISDSVTPDRIKVISDILSISDFLGANYSLNKSISDVLSINSGIGISRPEDSSDSIIISDLTSIKAPIYITLQDVLVFSDSDSSNLHSPSVQDILSFFEILNCSKKIGLASDTLTISDASGAFLNHQHINDLIIIGSTVRANLIHETLQDTLEIQDSFMQRGLILPDPVLTNLSIIDDVKTNQKLQSFSDSILISDTLLTKVPHQYLFDVLNIVDFLVNRMSKLNVFISDILTIQDIEQGYNNHVSDSILISDEVHRMHYGDFSDTITVSEYIGFPVNIEDHLLEIEDIVDGNNNKLGPPDTLSIIQIFCTQLILGRSISDSLEIIDQAVCFIPNNGNIDNNPVGGAPPGGFTFTITYELSLNSTIEIVDVMISDGGQQSNCVISD